MSSPAWTPEPAGWEQEPASVAQVIRLGELAERTLQEAPELLSPAALERAWRQADAGMSMRERVRDFDYENHIKREELRRQRHDLRVRQQLDRARVTHAWVNVLGASLVVVAFAVGIYFAMRAGGDFAALPRLLRNQ